MVILVTFVCFTQSIRKSCKCHLDDCVCEFYINEIQNSDIMCPYKFKYMKITDVESVCIKSCDKSKICCCDIINDIKRNQIPANMYTVIYIYTTRDRNTTYFIRQKNNRNLKEDLVGQMMYFINLYTTEIFINNMKKRMQIRDKTIQDNIFLCNIALEREVSRDSHEENFEEKLRSDSMTKKRKLECIGSVWYKEYGLYDYRNVIGDVQYYTNQHNEICNLYNTNDYLEGCGNMSFRCNNLTMMLDRKITVRDIEVKLKTELAYIGFNTENHELSGCFACSQHEEHNVLYVELPCYNVHMQYRYINDHISCLGSRNKGITGTKNDVFVKKNIDKNEMPVGRAEILLPYFLVPFCFEDSYMVLVQTLLSPVALEQLQDFTQNTFDAKYYSCPHEKDDCIEDIYFSVFLGLNSSISTLYDIAFDYIYMISKFSGNETNANPHLTDIVNKVDKVHLFMSNKHDIEQPSLRTVEYSLYPLFKLDHIIRMHLFSSIIFEIIYNIFWGSRSLHCKPELLKDNDIDRFIDNSICRESLNIELCMRGINTSYQTNDIEKKKILKENIRKNIFFCKSIEEQAHVADIEAIKKNKDSNVFLHDMIILSQKIPSVHMFNKHSRGKSVEIVKSFTNMFLTSFSTVKKQVNCLLL